MSANVETMMYVREKPWHGLGTMVTEAPTSADALKFAGLDWTVQQEPVYNSRGGIISGYKANVRDSDRSVLGMLANLDGICEHPDLGPCIFEAKTASAYKAGEWDDAIPDEYMLQIQHYMAVTGYRAAYITVLIGGNTFKWKLVERDEELISMLIPFEAVFWSHVQSMTPPPMDGSDASARFLSDQFPNSRPKSHITLPATADELLLRYDEACEQLEAATEQKQEAENKLKQMLGDNEVGTAGNRIITWKSVSQERLDSRTLKAEHPTIYNRYSTKTSYRRFSVKAAG